MKWNGKTALALCLGLAAVAAQAGTLYTMPAKGGTLMLNDTTSNWCREQDRRSGSEEGTWGYARLVSATGQEIMSGCWRVDNDSDLVHARFTNGEAYSYQQRWFTETDYAVRYFAKPTKPARSTAREWSNL